eukprot:CAMPEP_0116892318 /NCGR_PEP_ID=MMETSP0467-20121206/2576_1 /TAXON_ID=283647 /ORGANISM="Mesodinium pulex, Strain SPMC105" /LENGTH=93 /DNA_ID=CAMNT_0004561397 /DNA_START=340 /DNA_END=621 /DNA_ORIENTATION=+
MNGNQGLKVNTGSGNSQSQSNSISAPTADVVVKTYSIEVTNLTPAISKRSLGQKITLNPDKDSSDDKIIAHTENITRNETDIHSSHSRHDGTD